eukprot:m.367867 g.367867  ORF g.367867 m.367867 type:complete len:96 (-) comp42698_c0_seq1:1-288(-)
MSATIITKCNQSQALKDKVCNMVCRQRNPKKFRLTALDKSRMSDKEITTPKCWFCLSHNVDTTLAGHIQACTTITSQTAPPPYLLLQQIGHTKNH